LDGKQVLYWNNLDYIQTIGFMIQNLYQVAWDGNREIFMHKFVEIVISLHLCFLIINLNLLITKIERIWPDLEIRRIWPAINHLVDYNSMTKYKIPPTQCPHVSQPLVIKWVSLKTLKFWGSYAKVGTLFQKFFLNDFKRYFIFIKSYILNLFWQRIMRRT
jgi:hypothetical protein